MIATAVSGARGRVSQLILKAIEADKDFSLAVDVSDLDQNYLKTITTPIDVFIDFTAPAATLEYLAICQERRYPMVIGTTGFSELEKVKIAHAAQIIPIVFSPNMSVGVNIMYKLLALAANLLVGADRSHRPGVATDIAIVDIHHQHKKDAPSGTALKMAEVIRNAASDPSINISSVRLGDIIGEHSALFALAGERIEITHKATNRSLYAMGALQAAKWVVSQEPGLYDMQDVLGLRD
ncbi:MAG TPA: 4-hydroxy-tetrahydrodipicolinate reductase [Gammaproteobacteria bacterium]|nr:4-hydroxy-tetrahydrodipicolinate reductase [Gammaproteobacteria bacterium]